MQVALDGVQYLPTFDNREAPNYANFLFSPAVNLTMYVDPVLKSVFPPTGPMRGFTSVTIYGLNFKVASYDFSTNNTFCRFRVSKPQDSNLVWTWRTAYFLSDTSLRCTTPPTTVPVSHEIGITFNGQNFHVQQGVKFSYFALDRVDPPFGGVLGNTVLKVSGKFLDTMEVESERAQYMCKFSQDNQTIIKVATFQKPSNVICTAPAMRMGPAHLSIALHGNAFSNDPLIFQYVAEAFVNHSVPNTGPRTGGYRVVVTGQRFMNSTLLSCRFKLEPGLDVVREAQYLSPTTASCIAPETTLSGMARIYILNNGQQDSATFAEFTYFTVVDVLPDGGPVTGNTKVQVTISTDTERGWCRFGDPQHTVEGNVIVSQAYSNATHCQNCTCDSEVSNSSCQTNVGQRRPAVGRVIECYTKNDMSPSIAGAEVTFSVSLNNRDFAVATNFEFFTFYAAGAVDRLLPESGPLRGGTGVTLVGSNFFTLCRTAHDPVSGRCYECQEASTKTFSWGPDSSCSVTVPGSQNRGQLPWPSSRPCGLPCRPGMDDRDTFGASGSIYCKFGDIKRPARYMTPNRVKCFSPRTPTAKVETRLIAEVTSNDQQYTNSGNKFHYYTITAVSPSSVPTYGGTIVSVEGHNLGFGSGNGLEILCVFWLDIETKGGYDPNVDRVLCQVPEQPAEMRDNRQNTIDFGVSLNRNIPDQFTDARQIVEYFSDDMPTSVTPYKGPINGGFEILFKLPYKENPDPDFTHVDFPFTYQHYFSQRFRNETCSPDRRIMCFGTVNIIKNPIILLEHTCCDNLATEAECDGVEVPVTFLSEELLSVIVPPYSSPLTVNLDVSMHGIQTKASGLRWENTGTTVPANCREINWGRHTELAGNLTNRIEFTEEEWKSFGIDDLRIDDFIKSNAFYFKPAGSNQGICDPTISECQQANRRLNPAAQYSMQAACDQKINQCVQANRETQCIEHLDCGGLIFRYWGIEEVFPVAFDVQGESRGILLIGNNFPHHEDEPGLFGQVICMFFRASDDLNYANTTVGSNGFIGCDDCPEINRDGAQDVCIIERYCTAVQCPVPQALGSVAFEAYVEVQFGFYPSTRQRQKISYYDSAMVTRLDISAGPVSGGTKLIVWGVNFVNSSKIFCQFAVGNDFSYEKSHSQAYFINSSTLTCVSPMCDEGLVGQMTPGVCDICSQCNVPVQITMNSRDFLPTSHGNEILFAYRPWPKMHAVYPIRAPSQMKPQTSVTVTGLGFTDVGRENDVGFGLSCKFGQDITGAHFHSSCNSSSGRMPCSVITCVPTKNNYSSFVAVSVSIDTQQWQGVESGVGVAKGSHGTGFSPEGWVQNFAYYVTTKVQPRFALTHGGALLAVTGINVDFGRAYACKIFNASNVKYSPAASLDSYTVGCTVPPLRVGRYYLSISLDGDDIELGSRDYVGTSLTFDTYIPAIVNAVFPTKGEATGGIVVTLTGRNFWASSLLVCKFGTLTSVAATYINNRTVTCSSPPQFGTVYVEISFNGQEFSNNSQPFVNYYIPVVQSVVPDRIPSGYSRDVIVRGLYFEDFAEAACIFDSTVQSESGSRLIQQTVKAFFINSTAYRCQAPTGMQGTKSAVKVTTDGEIVSSIFGTLSHYNVSGMFPFSGPTTGGTTVVISGYALDGHDAPVCQYAAQPGLDVMGSRKDTVHFVEVRDAGFNYTDGTFSLASGECQDSEDQVYAIEIDGVETGYTDGEFYLNIECVIPCTGTGLQAKYVVKGEVVTEVVLLDPGTGYNATYPPALHARGCDGVSSSFTSCKPVNFKIRIGRTCTQAGCCQNVILGQYSVMNGQVQSVAITDGGHGFNYLFPPVLLPQGCGGSSSNQSVGCKVCRKGLFIPSGRCSSNANCSCSGSSVVCPDGLGTGTCRCSAPNDGAPCNSETDCTGNGKCVHSAQFRVLVANVTDMLGLRGQNNEILCRIPPVTYPNSVQGFNQTQSVQKQYNGMARIFVRIRIQEGHEFSSSAVIFHFYDQPQIEKVEPNSASSRGGTMVTISGSGFRREASLTTIQKEDGTEDSLRDMEITCRLHASLKSQLGVLVNLSHVLCLTNRVCFHGSTMSGCQDCIVEGCAQPVLDYSHRLPVNTIFSAEVALNDQNFVDDGIPFHVYSVMSFRPYGGVYNGGTHVSVAGINFDRGGVGPYDAHCKFSRIIVPARYDPVQQLIKCLSQPLLDIYTVLEVHLGSNLSDSSLWTDDRQIFHMYTAYPPGLVMTPNSGSFRGKQPLRFEVNTPHQFNHFRFRSLDFNTNLQYLDASLIIQGQRFDDPRLDRQLITIGRIISMELNLHMCLTENSCDGKDSCVKQCKIGTQHCIWERICQLSGDCQCRYPGLHTRSYVEDSDVVFGLRKNIDENKFELYFRIEPLDRPEEMQKALLGLLMNGTIAQMVQSDWVDKSIAILDHPRLDHLVINPQVLPNVKTYYSEFAAFARFGPLVTEGRVSRIEVMEAEIATSPVDSPATVQVSFCMNGQQFSQQTLTFRYYTVTHVVPFGIPIKNGTEFDETLWLSCPDISKYCKSTRVKNVIKKRLASIRIYGNNFGYSNQVQGAIYDNPKCRYGDFEDDYPLLGSSLKILEDVDGTLNREFGYVECPQPSSVNLKSKSDAMKRMRVEVALNGRDFSFSALDVNGPSGIFLFEEPEVELYEPAVGPITGNSRILITGKRFRKEASDSNPPTCFCLFEATNIAYDPAWMTVSCTVLSDTEVECVSPPFSENAYGYAASTFRQPPQDISIFVTLNGHHWHTSHASLDITEQPKFSFFDVRFLSPRMSSIVFQIGDDRLVQLNVGNFKNPNKYLIYCWWKVPGSTSTGSFVDQGTQDPGVVELYTCRLPDWSQIQMDDGKQASDMLPCNPSQPYDDATCNLDGSLEVPFGVAFIHPDVNKNSLKPTDFALTARYTFYARPRFYDFLPKMGDQLGGTEIHIYGENFLELPTLKCKFGDGPTQKLAEETRFVSPELVVCVTPKKTLLNTVALYLTINNVHWMRCESSPGCQFNHPYYEGAQRGCCMWTDTVENRDQPVYSFTYARRPTLSALQPNSAPSQGDSDLKIIGNNIVTGISGIVYACLIDGEIVRGDFKVDGGLQYMTCLTRPNMRVGQLEVRVSINEFEWSTASQILSVFEPLRVLRVNPAFTVWDNPVAEITIIGKNFITPDEQIGSLLVRLAEFDEEGVVRWKKDIAPFKFGPEILDVDEPALEPNILTDILTIEPPKRSPCTGAAGARNCEPGVVNVFVSQNEGTEWTWENTTFAFIREPDDRAECFGGIAKEDMSQIPADIANDAAGVCAVEANLVVDGQTNPFVRFIDKAYNLRGECKLGEQDEFGQAARSGTCVCTSSDCLTGAYNCGDRNGQLELGCSIKAAITDVSPRSGPFTGGTFVQIRGHKIENGTGYWCRFGSQDVRATLNTTHNLVQCVTPALGKNGSVEVEISISGGTSEAPEPGAEFTVSHGHHEFHYYAPPEIMGIEPSVGPATGGTRITITAGFTDALMALDTRYRELDVDTDGSAICSGELVGGLCKGMWLFGSYTDYGPISPGTEELCVSKPHCEYQLYQQHDLTCRFCSKISDYCFYSIDTTYLLPNVIQCVTSAHEGLSNESATVAYEDMTVEVTLNGQLWHMAEVNFRVHSFNNITNIYPEAGPAVGGTWVTLVGTGFIESHLTVCKFGARSSLQYEYINQTHLACQSPPNNVLEAVQVGVSFNGLQFEPAQEEFEYIAQWRIKKLYPQFAREVGGAMLSIIGFDFKDVSAIACKFGDQIVQKPDAVYVSENEILCRVPENIIKRPRFVTNEESCDGTFIRGSERNDTGWTICQGCQDCCDCPDCPDCMPACKCRDIESCCSPPGVGDNRQFASSCPPDPSLQHGQPRSLCLPPEYSCAFVSTDETTKALECTLLTFTGTLHSPPQSTTMILSSDLDFLHPDLALRLTLPFHVALDGQSWYSGCVASPFLGNTALYDPEYVGPPCITEDDSDVERWYGTFTYVEKPNITKFKPGIAPLLGETPISIIGEGFVDSQDIKCRFGWKDDGTFDADNPRDEETGELIGVQPNEVGGEFINSFLVVCKSPPLDTLVYDQLTKGADFVVISLQISMNGLPMEFSDSSVDFVYAEPWELSRIEPKNSPSIGGASITFYGPYFYDSGEIQCKFGNLFATEVTRVDDGAVVCRTPSVDTHQALNVSITVDGTTWSDLHNKSILEYFGVRNVLLFGENDFGQLGFGVTRERTFKGTRCNTGKYGKLPCEYDSDCPSGNCVEVNVLLNREPTFLEELFARNLTGIAMGQTHTLVISSETYSDDWMTQPRRGVVYTWGDNLVGQMAHGFAGPSYRQYNFARPSALVCLPSETYMLDRRQDSREILGLPEDWPEGDWIVPVCIREQDVKTEGQWKITTFVLYNPFYYLGVVRVAAGSFHSMAITENNDLYVWGWNSDGQLGLGPLDPRPNVPFPVKVLYFRRKLDVEADIVKISAGFSHSAALDSAGRLFTWGNNKYGQLGVGDYLSRRYPTEVTGFTNAQGVPHKIADVKCGLYHCIALTLVGSVYSFGSNNRGQLGTCDSIPILKDDMNLKCEIPTPVMDNQKVFSRNVPKLVDFLQVSDYAGVVIGRPFVTKIEAGSFHSLAIATPCITGLLSLDDPCPAFNQFAGDFYVWGNNKYGQLGVGTHSDMTYKQNPHLLRSLSTISARCREGETQDCVSVEEYFRRGKRVLNMAAGSWHTLLVLEQKEKIGYRRSYYQVNRLYTFGNNDEGQLGHGDILLRDKPEQVITNFVKFHELGGNFYQSIFTQGCPPNDALVCGGNGMCLEQGICDCYPGYKGQDCRIECDGGAENPCSGHGNNSMAIEMAKWRQQVILAASGHSLRNRLDRAFMSFVCTSPHKNYTVPTGGFSSLDECNEECSRLSQQDPCIIDQKSNISSPEVVIMLEQLVAEFPSMSTAVQIVRDDWPLHMFNQGFRFWKYAYHARGESLKDTTVGPTDGRWTKSDLFPILTMLQNRSTCWRSYSCEVGQCSVDVGYTRVTPGESMLDVNPGCRDGWTAQQHFRKRVEEVDQAWSNLEMENPFCDPQVVADKYGLRKEQVQYMWSSFESDPENVTTMMFSEAHDKLKYTITGDPIQKVLQVWEAFDVHCQNYTVGQVVLGGMLDGTCACDYGWTGVACDIECEGGSSSPCSWHGTCRADGKCICDRGWTGRACQIECEGARDNPDHWPCNLHGHCNGWYINPRTQLHVGPTDKNEEKYYSIGKGISFYDVGTDSAENGTCLCHYGYRSDLGASDCAVRCPGIEPKYLDEVGECFDNGICNMTGQCECFEGYRNFSCNVECAGGHLEEQLVDGVFSNECTAQLVCDVYPEFVLTTLDGPKFCKEMDPYDDAYSRDHKIKPEGQYLRVYNGLCQFEDFEPRLHERKLPQPECPGPEWCNPFQVIAAPMQSVLAEDRCGKQDVYCVEHLTKTRNYTGADINNTQGFMDPILGPPGQFGCPSVQCDHVLDWAEVQGYSDSDNRFRFHGMQPDMSPHHSTVMGFCYCLPGFRGVSCEQKCPGGMYSLEGAQEKSGATRYFPITDNRQASELEIYGRDELRGWDTNDDKVPDGVAGRPLINICSGNGFCEEDATCSCYLTDRGAHTNWTDISGWRGEACDVECPGGANSICSLNGICNDLGECACFKGYRNRSCNVPCLGIRDCNPASGCEGVCNYGGQCLDNGQCQCDAAYRGAACELLCPPYTGNPSEICTGHGNCNEIAFCECEIWYQGEACQRIADWVIATATLLTCGIIGCVTHCIRRWLYSRMRAKRRARRDRRKVRRTQAAVGRMKAYKPQEPDAVALAAKGI